VPSATKIGRNRRTVACVWVERLEWLVHGSEPDTTAHEQNQAQRASRQHPPSTQRHRAGNPDTRRDDSQPDHHPMTPPRQISKPNEQPTLLVAESREEHRPPFREAPPNGDWPQGDTSKPRLPFPASPRLPVARSRDPSALTVEEGRCQPFLYPQWMSRRMVRLGVVWGSR